MKILITGGPVHAKLDAVKIITNKFKGGLMCELVNNLADDDGVEITYLTAKGSKLPTAVGNIIYHDGFKDYYSIVINLAPQYDAVILGAAVANLIPMNPLEGKFPSHNYKVGDRIPIDFTIAPRVIDDVKHYAPKTHLFGFKLLSGVPHDELITAAYGVLLESHATAVFANDAKDLLQKYTVTKERGVHPMNMNQMVKFIKECVNDRYYTTKFSDTTEPYLRCIHDWHVLVNKFASDFVETPEGYVFGTIAIKNPDGSFLTTSRGKRELDEKATVVNVNHMTHQVIAYNGQKASLNAPLLDWIFRTNPKVHAIVHTHKVDNTFPTQSYAIPGTVRDSQRNVKESFNIEGHGCFILLDNKLQVII